MITHNGITIYRQFATIIHRGHKKQFQHPNGSNRVFFKMWEALILGAMSRDALFDALYGHRADGGPNQGVNQLSVRMHQSRSELVRMELNWISDRRGGVAYWKIIPTPIFNVQETADRILAHVV